MEDKGLVYVLLFSNPYDTKNADLEKKIIISAAKEHLLRLFKTSLKDDYKSKVPEVFFRNLLWFEDHDPENNTISKRKLLLDLISCVVDTLRNNLSVKCRLYVSRDNSNLFLNIYCEEKWLTKYARRYKYNLSFQENLYEEQKLGLEFAKVPPSGPLKLIDAKQSFRRMSSIGSDSVNHELTNKQNHFFKKYDESGPTVKVSNTGSFFLYIDKVRILLCSLNTIFDFVYVKNSGLMLSSYCVHQENRLNYLKENWANLRKLFSKQPLEEIQSYFSEKIAIYFAWMRMYLQYMLVLAVIGILTQISLEYFSDPKVNQGIIVAFSVFLILWSSVSIPIYSREEKTLSWKWRSLKSNLIDIQRGDFKGVFEKDEVTGCMKIIEKQRFQSTLRRIFSYSFVLIFVICLVIAAISVIFIRNLLFYYYGQSLYTKATVGLINAVEIKIMNYFYSKVAVKLNQWENHETDNIYYDHLAVKLFLFKFVNSYSSLFYIAFNDLIDNSMECKPNCLDHLKYQLIFIFISNLFMNLIEIGSPYYKVYKKYKAEKEKTNTNAPLENVRTHLYPVEKEAALEEYDSPLEDFMEMVIQFGYVTLFGSSFPIIFLLALIEIIIEIRVDAWKICNVCKRPNPDICEDIGVWKHILMVIVYAGIFSNSAIIFITIKIYNDNNSKTIAFLLLEQLLLIGSILIHWLFPTIPEVVAQGKIWSDRKVAEEFTQNMSEAPLQEDQAFKTQEFYIKESDINYA